MPYPKEEEGTTEDEMVGCHHQPDGHEFEQSLGVGDGQGSLVCGRPWGCSHTTEQLNLAERSSIHGAPDKCTWIQQSITLFTVVRMKESIHPAWSEVSL